MGAFGPAAKKVIYVDPDGPLSRDYRQIACTEVRQPIWPLDEQTAPGLIVSAMTMRILSENRRILRSHEWQRSFLDSDADGA